MLDDPLIVLFVKVSVDVSVTTAPSVAIDTLLSVTVVVIPLPPSKVKTSPKDTASVVDESSFIVITEFDNFALAILPANCAFVIVPTKDDVGYAVASDRSNAGVVSLAPNANETPPKFMVEFANF